jgi:hypothetical protein
MLHTHWPSVCSFLYAEQASSLKAVLYTSHQDHADENAECHGNDAFGEAVGGNSNVICLNGSCTSHGVAQVAIHLQVTSQGHGVVDVHKCRYGDVFDYLHPHLHQHHWCTKSPYSLEQPIHHSCILPWRPCMTSKPSRFTFQISAAVYGHTHQSTML